MFFLIDFDKKVLIKVTLKKVSFYLKPSKSAVVTFVKNFRKFSFENSGVYRDNFSQTWDKVSISFSNSF